MIRRRLRPALLRWAVGVFCALIGALMLVAPHQFAGPAFGPLRPWLTEWGAAFFAAGAVLITASAVGTRGPLAVATCMSAAAALLVLAFSFSLSGGWTGAAVYTVFGLATLLSPALDRSSAPGEESTDLFVIAAALAAVANGIVLGFVSGPTAGSMYDHVQAALSSYATLFLLGGIGVLVTRLGLRACPLSRGVTQAVLGIAYLSWLLGSSLPLRIWTGMLFYGGIGTLLLFGPSLARHLQRVDSSSLRVRLALAMASAAAIPLLSVAAVATGWQEEAAAEQQLALQQALAGGLAADVSGALTQHLVGLVLVAEHPIVLSRTPSGPDSLLGAVGEVAPGLLALGTFDRAGRPIVVLGGDDALAQTKLSAMAGEALRRIPRGGLLSNAFLVGGDAPSIVLAAPIRQSDGGLGGIAVGELDRRWLEQRLQRGIAAAHLAAVVVDAAGHVVVAAGEPVSGGTDLSDHPSVLALRHPAASSGTLRFPSGAGEYLAGSARVLGTDWAVVVEQPISSALASVWASRELTFVVLLAAFVVAAALGVALADRLAGPLAHLAKAAEAVAIGAPALVLPRSRLYEVRVVARAFAEMQARLSARTAERERAETRLRTLADASSDLTRSLDEAAIVKALATIVVGQLADWCTVDTLDDHGQVCRALTLHRDPARQGIVSALLETLPPLGLLPTHSSSCREPVVLSVVTPKQIAEMAGTVEHRRALEWLGMRSLIVVPLRVRDQTLGALTCVYGRGERRYTAEDLALAQELALRAALAIDNARLYAAERRARDDAEAAVRVREEFLAIAAHELKTPLTSLRGFAEIGVRAIDAHGAISPDIARRTLGAIERQSTRLSALVANLLEVARGSADRSAIVPRRVNLADLVQGVVELARARTERHTIVLDAADPVELNADPLRIEQVLTNLIDNAVKYSPVDTGIEITLRATMDEAQITVRDHGMGIPHEHQRRIFDRFFQAHVGEQSSGMGLGLYISREIVRRHGGTIRVESSHDGGTRMIVTLPRDLPLVLVPEPRASPEPVAADGQRLA